MSRLTSFLAAALVAAALACACTPDIDTDPLPEVMEFDPAASPPRVSEPSFVVRDRTTGLIDLGLAGIDVPADCSGQPATAIAQCEFNQYLESLDGFPTAAGARAPVSAAVDLTTATVPGNVAVIEKLSKQRIDDVTVSFDSVGRYLQVAPRRSWPAGGFVWIAVRGYDNGIRAGGSEVVASVVYNLLKREDQLTCGAQSVEAIPDSCPYLALLAQQMSAAAARASLAQLEPLRQAMAGFEAWTLSAVPGGIPKAEAAMVWGFPLHSNPVIDLNPTAGLVPQPTGADGIRLVVNGELDPATVSAFRLAGAVGPVVVMNLSELAEMRAASAFPAVTASYQDGAIVIKADAPFVAGKTYGIVVTKGAQSPKGLPLVRPPVSVLLMARGPLVNAGKSTVSSVSDADAMALEGGRQQLGPLLDNPTVFGAGSFTNIKREDIAYLFAFTWGP
jgi:hypothetical protein